MFVKIVLSHKIFQALFFNRIKFFFQTSSTIPALHDFKFHVITRIYPIDPKHTSGSTREFLFFKNAINHVETPAQSPVRHFKS